jgi:hypothetical protein|tara:strand:- start:225 stop:824 length:600 start_codon:yes stop_codon:yes gene_type:complete
MSGTLPTSPQFSAIGFTSEQKTITSTTDSGKMFSTQIDGQRFSFTASYPTISRTNFAPVYAFIMKQRGQQETFQVILPVLSSARGHENGTVLVDGVHTAGDTTITVNGHHNDGTGAFLAGDLIKFAGHTKVYMITADVNPSSNASTLNIEPPLRSNLANDEAVTYDDVPFTVRLSNDVQQFKTSVIDQYTFELDFIEAL